MSIGKNIAKYRKAKRLTQEELGEKLGVTNQAVSKWESEASMPDVMLLPEIATALNITLDDLYGIAKEPEKISCSADDFPAFCHQKLIELFYYNTKMRFTHIGSSDKEQLEFQIKKLMEGCRIGCLSNKEGAIVTTEDFSFIDNTYKAVNSENVIKSQADDYTLMYLTDKNFRKVFYYQYKTAFEKSNKLSVKFFNSSVFLSIISTYSSFISFSFSFFIKSTYPIIAVRGVLISCDIFVIVSFNS